MTPPLSHRRVVSCALPRDLRPVSCRVAHLRERPRRPGAATRLQATAGTQPRAPDGREPRSSVPAPRVFLPEGHELRAPGGGPGGVLPAGGGGTEGTRRWDPATHAERLSRRPAEFTGSLPVPAALGSQSRGLRGAVGWVFLHLASQPLLRPRPAGAGTGEVASVDKRQGGSVSTSAHFPEIGAGCPKKCSCNLNLSG